MKTQKMTEAQISAASTDDDRARRAKELEELAQERLMRERYAEEYRRKLLAESAPVSNISEEKTVKEQTDFFDLEESEKSATPVFEPKEQKAEDGAAAVGSAEADEREEPIVPEEPSSTEKSPEPSNEECENPHTEDVPSHEAERFVINKHYSGCSDGKLSLPGTSLVITYTAEPQVLGADAPSKPTHYSAVPIDNGAQSFFDKRFVVVPTEFPSENIGGIFIPSDNPFSKENFPADVSLFNPTVAASDADFEAENPSGCHDVDGHCDELRYDYTAEPGEERYSAPNHDYAAEVEIGHHDEPRYDYTAEPGEERYSAPNHDYAAEVEVGHLDESVSDVNYVDLSEEQRKYYDAPSVPYGIDEEYLRFLKENEAIGRGNRKNRQSAGDASANGVKTVAGSGIAAAVQKSCRTVEKRMLHLVGRIEHNLRMREYTFAVYDAKEERALRCEENTLAKMKRKTKRALSEDKKALMRYYSALASNGDAVGCKNPQKLESIKRRLEQLLLERDEINDRLCELYRASAFAEPSRIDRKAGRIKLKYTKMLYKNQRKLARRLEKLHAPIDLKKKIYDLMNKKTEASSDIEKSRYLLKSKNATGAKRRELKLKIKESKRTLRYIDADIKYFCKKAEKHHDRHIDDFIHAAWVIGALFVAVAGCIIWQNYEAVKAWFLQFI